MLTQLTTLLLLLWAGMVLGISFLESWVKFRAPTLTKSIGLDVGRTVFSFFHTVQIGLAFIIIFLTAFAKLSISTYMLIAFIILTLAIQTVIFLPRLNERVSIIIAGDKPPSSYVHMLYGVAEIVKFLLLCICGIMLIH